MTPSTETWLISTISKRLERIAEGKEPMAEDRALTLLSILKDVAGDIPSLTNLPQHVKEWLEAAVNARLDAIAEKREIAAEDRIATLTEALAALRPPAPPGGAVELVDTGVGLSGGPITTTGTISLSTSSQQAIARANTSVQPEDLADVATSGNYADLSNTPTIPEQFNPVQGANMLITGTYPNITFSAVAGGDFTPVWGEIQGTLANQTDLQNALDGKAPTVHTHTWGQITGLPAYATRWPTYAEVTGKPTTFPPSSHTHAAGDINSGTFANARISQSSVTQHQAALSIGWVQLTGLPAFATRWPSWSEVSGKPSIPNQEDIFLRASNSNKVGPASFSINDGSDLNDWAGAFFGYAHTATLNKPPIGNSNILGFGLSGYNVQIASRVHKLYFRTQENTSWGDWNEVWHSGNFDPDSKINQSALSTNDVSNSVALRTGSADLIARLFRSTYANQATIGGAIAFRYNNGGNNYIRFCNSPSAIRGWLGLGSAATSSTGDFVTSSGNQTSLHGNKGWTGTHSFHAIVTGRLYPQSTGTDNFIRMDGATGSNRWLRFRRGGSGSQNNAGTVYSNYGNNHWFVFNDGQLRFNRSTQSEGANAPAWSSSSNIASLSASGFSVNGAITGTNLTATSDPRLKTNKKKVKARRELIEKLEYWSFEWKKDGTKGRSVMADKVQEIAPEHVHVADDEKGTLSVDKGALALEMVFAIIDVLKEQELVEGEE